MKKVILGFCAVVALVGAAEDEAAKGYTLVFTPALNGQLNLFSKNWVGGDLGSFTWTSSIDFTAEKQLNEKVRNENFLKLRYGQTALQGLDSTKEKSWSDFQKSTDLIEGESVLKFTLGAFADPYLSVKGKSQFFDNRVESNHRRVNPVELKEAFGAARVFVEKELSKIDGRLGAAARQNIDRDVVVSGEWETTNDMGLDLVLSYNARRADDLFQYKSTFEVFQALYRNTHDSLTAKEITEYRTPDVRWEHLLKVNVSKVLIFTLGVEFLYDREIDKDIQLRENLSAGLSYTFRRN